MNCEPTLTPDIDLTSLREKQRLESELDTSLTRLARQDRTRPRIRPAKQNSAPGRFRKAES